jgi:signal transduction histidine kinase
MSRDEVDMIELRTSDVAFASCPTLGKPMTRLKEKRGLAQRDQNAAVIACTRVEQQRDSEPRARATRRLAVLGEMTGGIAHDFRNILAIIESGLRLAEKHCDRPEKMRVFIAGAREGVDRGLKLTSELLTFAKQGKLEPHATNVNELLKTLELFLQYGAGSEIRVVFQLASGIPKCLIDPAQFSAAVLNLVVNARDAMPTGGEIQIITDRWEAQTVASDGPAPGVYVRVSIKDTGHGIPAAVLEQIFDPLFTTKGEKGTGLGLPQVCAFMRLMRGYVMVNSEPGVGTQFDLLFPEVRSDEEMTKS